MKSIVVLVLCAVVVTAFSKATHPDCLICLRGQCFAPAAFFDDRETLYTTLIAVNYNDNIMYYDDLGTLRAVNLDTNTFEQIPKINSVRNKFEVDQTNGHLYYYDRYELEQNQNTIHMYQPKTNETKIITVPNPDSKKPLSKLKIYNGTLYFTRKRDVTWSLEKGLNVFDGTTLQRVAALENVNVNDIVFDGFGKMYIKSDEEVYKLKKNKNGVEELSKIYQATAYALLKKSIVGNANGELYVFDPDSELIYQLDPDTDKFNEIGAIGEPSSVRDVMLDKNNNIISKDVLYSNFNFKISNDKCVYERDEEEGVTITKV